MYDAEPNVSLNYGFNPKLDNDLGNESAIHAPTAEKSPRFVPRLIPCRVPTRVPSGLSARSEAIGEENLRFARYARYVLKRVSPTRVHGCRERNWNRHRRRRRCRGGDRKSKVQWDSFSKQNATLDERRDDEARAKNETRRWGPTMIKTAAEARTLRRVTHSPGK